MIMKIDDAKFDQKLHELLTEKDFGKAFKTYFPNGLNLDSLRLVQIPKEIDKFRKYDRQKLKEFYPVAKGNYLLRDLASCFHVMSPNEETSLMKLGFEFGAILSGSCITNSGLVNVIVNTVSNPNARFIFVVGKDSSHKSGICLYSLWKHGLNSKTREIIGYKKYLKHNEQAISPFIFILPLNAIERFRKQVTVVPLIGVDDPKVLGLFFRAAIQEPHNAIKAKIDGFGQFTLYDPGRFPSPPLKIDIAEQLAREGGFEVLDRYGSSIHAPDPVTGWRYLTSAVLRVGKETTLDWTKGLETLGTTLVIRDPTVNRMHPEYRPEKWIQSEKQLESYMKKYSKCYLEPQRRVVYDQKTDLAKTVKDASADSSYNYGTRLTMYGIEEVQFMWSSFIKFFQRTGLVDGETLAKMKQIDPKIIFDYLSQHKQIGYETGLLINQIEQAVKAVRWCVEKNVESYRLVLSLSNPKMDFKVETEKIHPPCLTQIWLFPRKYEGSWHLDMEMLMRAHDVHEANLCNVWGGTEIQRYIAGKVGIKVGVLILHAGSAHVYKHCLAD